MMGEGQAASQKISGFWELILEHVYTVCSLLPHDLNMFCFGQVNLNIRKRSDMSLQA